MEETGRSRADLSISLCLPLSAAKLPHGRDGFLAPIPAAPEGRGSSQGTPFLRSGRLPLEESSRGLIRSAPPRSGRGGGRAGAGGLRPVLSDQCALRGDVRGEVPPVLHALHLPQIQARPPGPYQVSAIPAEVPPVLTAPKPYRSPVDSPPAHRAVAFAPPLGVARRRCATRDLRRASRVSVR